jgi:hypothetical protein
MLAAAWTARPLVRLGLTVLPMIWIVTAFRLWRASLVQSRDVQAGLEKSATVTVAWFVARKFKNHK